MSILYMDQAISFYSRATIFKCMSYSVCRAQKAFDCMEIRAVLEALSEKGIKEVYIGIMKGILF